MDRTATLAGRCGDRLNANVHDFIYARSGHLEQSGLNGFNRALGQRRARDDGGGDEQNEVQCAHAERRFFREGRAQRQP